MKIGFLSISDPDNPDHLSGMPHAMKRQLQRGAQVVNLLPRCAIKQPWRRLRSSVVSRVPIEIKERWRTCRAALDRQVGSAFPNQFRNRLLSRARGASREVQDQLEAHGVDLLFGCCISTLLYDLETDLPVVYFSDATAWVINSTYPRYASRSSAYKEASDLIEGKALHTASAAIFATRLVAQSAIRDYGVAPDRVHVVPMGANALSNNGNESPIVRVPTRTNLTLCMVASDPVRKGLDLAIDAVKILYAQGWRAHLVYVGPPTQRAKESPHVTCLGEMRLSNAAHRRRYLAQLARAHLMLLASVGEVYGIAPCEAAHEGKPSIVSAAGGLPEVVLDGQTGLVLPTSATAGDYATAIERLATDPARYLAMCESARSRAQKVFTWDHWGDRTIQIIEQVLAGRH